MRLQAFRLPLMAVLALVVTLGAIYVHLSPPQPLNSWLVENVHRDRRHLLPDERTLITLDFTVGIPTESRQIRYWDITSGEQLRHAEVPNRTEKTPVPFPDDLWTMVSSDGNWLAVEDVDGNLDVYDTGTALLKYTLPTTADNGWASKIFRNYRFAPDSRLLAYEKADGKAVVLWDLTAGRPAAVFEGGTAVFEFSPDGKTLCTSTSDSTALKLWDVASGQVRATLEGHAFPAGVITFTADGKRLATGLNRFRPRQPDPPTTEIIIWNALTGQRVTTIPIENKQYDGLSRLNFGKDGELLLATNNAWHNLLWDLSAQPPRERHQLFCQNLRDLVSGPKSMIEYRAVPSFSPDGKWLAMGEEHEDYVQLLDTATLTLRRRIHIKGVKYCWFSPDSRFLLARLDYNAPVYASGWLGWWDRLAFKPPTLRHLNETAVCDLSQGGEPFKVPGSFWGHTSDGRFLVTAETIANSESSYLIHRWAIPHGPALCTYLYCGAGLLWVLLFCFWWSSRQSNSTVKDCEAAVTSG